MIKFVLFCSLFLCVIAAFPQTTFIPLNAEWKFDDNGLDLKTSWSEVSYNDHGWKSGPGKLGYGIGDVATVLRYGNNANNKHITTYFRKQVVINNPRQYTGFKATIYRDDGALVYLNGKEVFRTNIPPGPVNYLTRGFGASNDGGTKPHVFEIHSSAFVDGVNIIAVEVHQSSPTSSDIAFDFKLEGLKQINKDLTPPSIKEIIRRHPSTDTTSASTLTYRVIFTEDVKGVDEKDFRGTVLNGHLSFLISTVTPVSGTNDKYDVRVDKINGNGILRLELEPSSDIHDGASNKVEAGFNRGEVYVIKQAIRMQNASLVRGPYLQMANQGSVTLRWRTDVATDSKIEVGATNGNYTVSATNPDITKEHEVRISALSPDTRYYYRFGSSSQVLGGDSSHYFYTAPPPTTTKKIRIAAFGDCGKANTPQRRVLNSYLQHTGSKPAELMLLLGDNAYEDGLDDEFQTEFFERYQNAILKNHIIFPSPGNHDYHPTTKAERTAPYYNIFSMPTAGECGGVPSGTKAFYSFDWGNIHFLSLDSYGEEQGGSRMYDTLGPQVSWIKQDLAANTKKWTIVYFHHPPFTMGTHNSDISGDLSRIRRNLMRILERYGVDLILCGHSHAYERSYLLKGYYEVETAFRKNLHTADSSSAKYDGSPNSCAYLTDSGQINHGAVYVVAGSAARSGAGVEPSFPHDALPFATTDGGMFYIEVEDNRLDGKMLHENGSVFDQFTIVKDANKNHSISSFGGESHTLTASWIGSYQWSTGDTTRSITVVPAASTTYTATDGQNCLRDTFHINMVVTSIPVDPQTDPQSGIRVKSSTFLKRGESIVIENKSATVYDAAMLDTKGRLIRRLKLTGTTAVETNTLPTGIYFIAINNKNKYYRIRVVIGN